MNPDEAETCIYEQKGKIAHSTCSFNEVKTQTVK